MSYSVDANIFVYCADMESPLHERAIKFIDSKLESDDVLYLPWIIAYTYLRIVTHPGIFRYPLSQSEAMENVEQIIEHPHVEMLSDSKASWNIYKNLHLELSIKGNLVPDAHIASILESNGIRAFYTNDSDYWKFSCLNPINPFK